MAEKQKIIIEAVLEGKTQRRIAKEMKISRTTVARYLREYEKAKSKRSLTAEEINNELSAKFNRTIDLEEETAITTAVSY